MIKHFIKTLLIVFLAFTACHSTKSMQQKTSLNNQWELIEYLGSPLDSKIFKRSIPTFTLNTNEGKFGGNNGCNSISGNLSVRGSTIKMQILLGTKMFCYGFPEKEIQENISDVDNYIIFNEQLFLKKGEETIFVFKLVEAK